MENSPFYWLDARLSFVLYNYRTVIGQPLYLVLVLCCLCSICDILTFKFDVKLLISMQCIPTETYNKRNLKEL